MEPDVLYYYWVRASDNAQGSNTTGYSSGFSGFDTGWAADSTMSVRNYYSAGNYQVLPNPCNELIKINFDTSIAGLFQLFDSMGDMVMSK